jgi:flagellar hook-associated protein 3 FlgL
MQKLNSLNNKIVTGQDVNAPSDAPDKIGRIINLSDSLNNIDQYKKNLDETVKYMESSDSALSSMSGIMSDASVIAVKGANDTYTASDRATMATDIDNKIQQMLALANTQVEGKYIFAGYKTTTKPFNETMAGTDIIDVTYSGDSGLMPEEVGKGEIMNKNIPGTAFKNGTIDVFKSLITLRDDLRANNTAAISADIDATQNVSDDITKQRADLGGKIKRTDNVDSTITLTKTTLTKLQSSLADTDMTTVMSNYQLEQNVYQAAITSISKILQQTSLADILR